MKILLLAALSTALNAAIIPEVRALVNQQDFDGATKAIEAQRANGKWTPELIEAQSWLGRGALFAKQYDRALGYSAETRKLVGEALKTTKLDSEKRLPIALGASIEVKGQALAGKGELGEALSFLQQEVKTYRLTSMRARIQKNINLLSLIGKPAPALEIKEYIGAKAPAAMASLKGKPVVLFFWAHWCGDCKAQAPIIAELAAKYAPRGLRVVGPTQHYGYIAGGEDAPRKAERAYIATVYDKYYATIPGMTMPLSEENFRVWGASTTPTLALVDKSGIVRLYNPGKLTKEELAAKIEALL